MPECHRCNLNGTGSNACLKCPGPPTTNHKGRVFVSMDSGDNQQTGAEVEAAMQEAAYEPPTVEEIALPDCCADTARRLLATVAALDDAELLLLMRRLRGQSLASIAGSRRQTRQASHAQWNRIVARHQELAAVFPKLRKV
jgi:hypothetical protein